MVAEHLGDVYDEIGHLCDLAGVPRPEGNFEEGWTAQDWSNVRSPSDAGTAAARVVHEAKELLHRYPATTQFIQQTTDLQNAIDDFERAVEEG